MTTKPRCGLQPPPHTHTQSHKHRRYSLSLFYRQWAKPLRNPVGEMHCCRLVCKHCAVGDTSRSSHLTTHNCCNRDAVETLHVKCDLACTWTDTAYCTGIWVKWMENRKALHQGPVTQTSWSLEGRVTWSSIDGAITRCFIVCIKWQSRRYSIHMHFCLQSGPFHQF